jgi:hypothetical protein
MCDSTHTQHTQCERKLTPGVYLRDVSLQHLRRHVDCGLLENQQGTNEGFYFFVRTSELFSFQHPRYFGRYSIVLNHFTLSACRSISREN